LVSKASGERCAAFDQDARGNIVVFFPVDNEASAAASRPFAPTLSNNSLDFGQLQSAASPWTMPPSRVAQAEAAAKAAQLDNPAAR
jgi:hypothetical protein